MDEADVVARGALPDAAGRETNALLGQPGNGLLEVVHPEAHVIERRFVNLGALLRVDRLHQVDFDLEGALARYGDVLVDVLGFAAIATRRSEAQCVDPKAPQRLLVQASNGDLLQAEN